MNIEEAALKVSNLLVDFGSRCTVVAAYDPSNPHIEVWTDELQLISSILPSEIDGYPVELQPLPKATAQRAKYNLH